MSSSLKERLKRCGRYHPGTPTTPSTLQDTHKNPAIKMTNDIVSFNSQSTPSTDVQRVPDLSPASSNSRKILSSVKFEDRIRSVHKASSGDSQVLIKDQNLNPSQNTEQCVKDLVPTSSSSNVSPDLSSCLRTTEVEDRSRSETLQTDPVLCEESVEDLLAMKKELQVDLQRHEEQLRKLRMVKMYREKNNLTELQELIDTWRGVSQKALTDLLELQPPPQPTMTDLINHLQIDPEFIGYNAEEEGFS